MSSEPLDLGVLEALLTDPGITGIRVDEDAISYEIFTRSYRTDLTFVDAAQRQQVVESIVQAGGQTLSAANPLVDCVLDDGTRIHAEYAPLLLTIQKRR